MGRVLVVVNVSLGLIALLLLLNLFDVQLPSLGRTISYFDPTPPICAVQWGAEFTQWQDIDRCCLEVRKQLACFPEKKELNFGKLDWRCQTGKGTVLRYWVNNKAYQYCTEQRIWR